jgi:chaperonin GroEL (HSP60 family)
MEAVLEDSLILLYEKRLTNLKDLLPLLEQVARNSRPLLIVAEEVEGRGVGDTGIEQGPRYALLLRSEGARIWRQT